jgi:hypothetical protein
LHAAQPEHKKKKRSIFSPSSLSGTMGKLADAFGADMGITPFACIQLIVSCDPLNE